MSADGSTFTVIDGFRCYAPHLASTSDHYPKEGFEVSANLEDASFWCQARSRILRDVIVRFTDESKHLAMLEIGCGIGGLIAELRRFAHLRVTASDISLEGLRFARSRFPDIEFIQLDAAAMPFRSQFDVIGAFDVLEHLDADERAMTGVHQALRANGLFIVTVPQHPWMWSPLDDIVCHRRRYTRSDLLAKLSRAGFAVLFASSFVTAAFPAMVASRLIGRRRRLAADRQTAFAAQVTLPPFVNGACDWLMRIDEAAIRQGISLPFGGSLLAVARKQ